MQIDSQHLIHPYLHIKELENVKLIHLRTSHHDTGIDAHNMSGITLEDLNLENSPWLTLRIGVKEDAVNQGGVTIFGDSFGNAPQNILLTLYYSETV